ncbi:MAG: hypothetical protein ABIJ60_00505, partial [Patescibacteria group bacterium]
LIIIGGFFVLPVNAQAAELGEQVNFYVDSNYDISGRNQLNAELKVIGNFIYFYVEIDYYNRLNITQKSLLKEKLKDLANEFDQVIYPKERAIFGSEWSPGIDNDVKITVLVSELVSDAGGYFNTFDEYPRSQVFESNEREMIYLNVLSIFNPKNKSFLAHEFQHLISFYQKTKLYGLEEEVWLNEARSEYAPTVCGYNDKYVDSYLANRVDTFLDEPSDSLTEWKNKVVDYGAASLFIHYLVDHYGEEVLTRMVLNNKVGIASIDKALSDLGHTETFSDIFADWSVANYLNDCQIGTENKYCYLNKNLTYQRLHTDYTVSYSGFPNLIVSRSSSIKDWLSYWYRFRQGTVQSTDRDTLKLEFTGSDNKGDFRVPYIVIDQNNQTTVKFISLEDQKGIAYIPNFTSLNKSVIMIPFNQYQKENFGANESSTSFTFTASSVDTLVIEDIVGDNEDNNSINDYPEGSLLRAKNDYKVYIIKGNYKRWVQSAEIFNQYEHLHWKDIIDVDLSVLDQYKESWLIRADGDKKVYELNADGTKHWLNMTAEQFTITGHLWDMVYITNSFERDSYTTGSDVMYGG